MRLSGYLVRLVDRSQVCADGRVRGARTSVRCTDVDVPPPAYPPPCDILLRLRQWEPELCA
eukprot:scaffold113942_cov72-Phaeocystis_antarctica.AAC.1